MRASLLRKLRQEDCHESEESLGYIVRPSQNKPKTNQNKPKIVRKVKTKKVNTQKKSRLGENIYD